MVLCFPTLVRLGMCLALMAAACGDRSSHSVGSDADAGSDSLSNGGVSNSGSSSGGGYTSSSGASTSSGSGAPESDADPGGPAADAGASGSGSGNANDSSPSSPSGDSSNVRDASGFDPCPAAGSCKVLPLGDSITYGSPTNNGGYRVELFTRAVTGRQQLTFVGSQSDGPATVAGMAFPENNEGHPGWTIAQITGIANPSSALEGSPEIVLLHIGTNDLPNSLSGASDRLAQLVDQILTALPSSLLVVAQIMPLPWAESSVVTYNAAIPGVVQARAAKGKHIILVDMNTGFPSSNGFASDNIHPNDTVGYPWMGDKWYATIAPYLH
jgi:lysophospholipase L1-like esterase